MDSMQINWLWLCVVILFWQSADPPWSIAFCVLFWFTLVCCILLMAGSVYARYLEKKNRECE